MLEDTSGKQENAGQEQQLSYIARVVAGREERKPAGRLVHCYPRDGEKHANPNRVGGPHCSNAVSSTRYPGISFVPKNLFEQFQRAANLYFLLMACIVQIPGLSPLAPITSVLPLVFVVGVTMIKQGWEDLQRAAADRVVNHQ
eukprot:gene3176-28383_t